MPNSDLNRETGKGMKNCMTEQEFENLSGLIHSEFGILIRDGRMLSLHAKLAHRLSILGLASYSEYIDYLKDNRDKEIFNLASHITNNETFFLREANQYEALPAFLQEIKRHRQAAGQNIVHIISAGCSTGEEIYNLNIVNFESGLFAWNWKVALTGIDIDMPALKRAGKAVFGRNSFRNGMDEEFKRKYFHASDSGYRLKATYRANVAFRHGNILAPETFSGLEKADAIFCRNVFIYMSDEAIARAARNFHAALNDWGCLFVGSSETLIRKTGLFTPEYRDGVVVYRKQCAKR